MTASTEHVNRNSEWESEQTLTVEADTLSKIVVMIRTSRALSHIEIIVELGIVDKELLRVDADDWA